MGLKDILVHVDNGSSTPARLRVATALAQEHEAHLTGLYVDPGIMLPQMMDVPIPGNLLAELEEQAASRRAEAEQTFKTTMAKTKVLTEWRTAQGGLVRNLELHGRYADLLIVGQTCDNDAQVGADALADSVVLGVGRPVLVVPCAGAPSTLGRNVLVAWNASRESVRAVNDALPFLHCADVVEVMYVDPPSHRAHQDHVAGTDISLHLARHGVKVVAHQVKGNGIDTGDTLLSQAVARGSDLIVMGAYGHSRMRELVFGGVTRHLLKHMTIPVLMSH